MPHACPLRACCGGLQIQELQLKLQQAQSEAAQKQASQGELQERARKAQDALEVRPVKCSNCMLGL